MMADHRATGGDFYIAPGRKFGVLVRARNESAVPAPLCADRGADDVFPLTHTTDRLRDRAGACAQRRACPGQAAATPSRCKVPVSVPFERSLRPHGSGPSHPRGAGRAAFRAPGRRPIHCASAAAGRGQVGDRRGIATRTPPAAPVPRVRIGNAGHPPRPLFGCRRRIRRSIVSIMIKLKSPAGRQRPGAAPLRGTSLFGRPGRPAQGGLRPAAARRRGLPHHGDPAAARFRPAVPHPQRG